MFQAEVIKYDTRPDGSDDGKDESFETYADAVTWITEQAKYGYSRAWINNDEHDIRSGKSKKYLAELVKAV